MRIERFRQFVRSFETVEDGRKFHQIRTEERFFLSILVRNSWKD